MWLITVDGCYSVAEDRENEERVLVRTRARADLEALIARVGYREQAADPAIFVMYTPTADYPYRAFLDRQQWAAYAYTAALAIDYPAFKAAVAERNPKRAETLISAWGALLAIEDEEKAEASS